ncbi:M48 family metallopeptidase [Magnetospirillum aberrantis]|uniref:M48 family metallopeptidase n=1 Tax=Magnetospirillum aberrantis SpK TaxID=908842 RepID=A0A7C9UZ22_9PROT|nr:M48 family metallopeptidase [Magnetospirillum aberrantis]NFV80251.1 M48 family metallopeptidase [Magnetospirillum aberrantis SpK]
MTALPGRFNDGRTAASRQVTVTPGTNGLDIRGEDGLMVAFWKTADLRADGELPDGAGVRLRCAADPDARLSLAQAEFIRPLLPKPPRFPWLKLAGTFAGALGVLAALWLGIPAGARALAIMVPSAWEKGWGDTLADELERRWGTCRQPAGDAALQLLAARLGAGIAPDLHLNRLVVVRRTENNALALPGGSVLVFSGLLAQAESSDELAGVLAHEFTHLRLRHPTVAMIRAAGIGMAVMLVTGDASGLAASGAAMAMAGAYSRDDESAADAGAVTLLTQAGIGTQGLAAFFRRLDDGPPGLTGWLSTHPDSRARAQAVETQGGERQAPAATRPALEPEQWAAIKGICGQ